MIQINRNFCLLIALLFAISSKSQSDDEQLKRLEQWIENTDQSGDYTDLIDQMPFDSKLKLNINKATTAELISLKILTPLMAKAIISHREGFGPFLSVLELQTIDEIPLEILPKLCAIVEAKEPSPDHAGFLNGFANSEKEFSVSTWTSRPLKRGFISSAKDSSNAYKGSPFQYRLKLNEKTKHGAEFGINAEKDEGEDFFTGSNQKGFDYYSGYFFLAGNGFVKKIALGDFQAGFGQGLTFSSGSGFGKSSAVLNIKKNFDGLRPYHGYNESEFLRGGAMAFGYKRITVSIFISRQKLDANLDGDTSSFRDRMVIRSFSTEGFHRSNSEIEREKVVARRIVGDNVICKFRSFEIGVTTMWNSYNYTLVPKENLYNRYYFSGKQFFKTGFNFDYTFKNLNFYGEGVIGTNNSNAYIIGAFISLADHLDLVYSKRCFSKSFIWYNTNGLSEGSNPNNEQGNYFGLNIKLSKKLSLSGFLDIYKALWYSFNTDGLARGNDILSELNFHQGKTTRLYLRLRIKQKMINTSLGKRDGLQTDEKINLRFHAECMLLPSLRFQARMEYSHYKTKEQGTLPGSLIYIDIAFKPKQSPLSFASRIAWFDVADFESRIYAVESNVGQVWSVPGFYGAGTKFYLLLKYKYRKNITFQGRYSTTQYMNRTSIGSGYNQINSAKLHEINLQLSYRFM